MNAILNETQLWYCDICDKTIKIKSIAKHKNSRTPEHKQKNGIVVKEYYCNNPDIDHVNYIPNDTIKGCRK